MKVGDLVKSYHDGLAGMIMEEEKWNDGTGYWVEYFEDRENWRWYSWDELSAVEVISESR